MVTVSVCLHGRHVRFFLFLFLNPHLSVNRLSNHTSWIVLYAFRTWYWFWWCLWVQPHGFFNCSPAIDVPPNACELEAKDNDVKDSVVAKPIQPALLAKLWRDVTSKFQVKFSFHLIERYHYGASPSSVWSYFTFQVKPMSWFSPSQNLKRKLCTTSIFINGTSFWYLDLSLYLVIMDSNADNSVHGIIFQY